MIDVAGHTRRRRGHLEPTFRRSTVDGRGTCRPALRRRISVVFRAASSDNVDKTGPYNIAAAQPTGNQLQLVAIEAAQGTAAEAPTGITGRGLNWVKIGERFHGAAATIRKLSLWRAMGPAPTDQALAVNFAGTMTSVIWIDVEVYGADPSGVDGAGAIAQAVSAGANAGTTINNLLAALEHALNAHLAIVGLNAQGTVTPSPGFTTVGQDNETSATCTLEMEYALGQLSCDPTFASSISGILSVEIKAGMA